MVDSVFNNALSAYNNAANMAKRGGSDGTKKDTVSLSSGQPVARAELPPVATPSSGAQAIGQTSASQKPTFPQLLDNSLDRARGASYKGEATSINTLTKTVELHEMVTAVTNAELTLKTVVAVRDKVINAYQDIIKMPI